MKKEICEIMGISQASYYRWREERPVIKMIEKYFNEDDLREFLESGKIYKLEKTSKKEADMQKFFAQNGAYKLYMQRHEIISIWEIREDITTDEIEEITNNDQFLLEYIISIVINSKSVEEFYKKIEEEELREINAILNPLEIQGMISNKEYTAKKIRELEELQKRENFLNGIEDDDTIVEEEDDNEDYETLQEMRDIYGNPDE